MPVIINCLHMYADYRFFLVDGEVRLDCSGTGCQTG